MANARGNTSLRIVSLAPSVTSILLALGAGPQLVGITKWCKDVVPGGTLPQRLVRAPLGDCWSLDALQVAQRRPNLIIGSVPYKTETVTQLLAMPVPFLATNPRSLADIYAEIRLLGRIVDRDVAAAGLVRRMRATFAKIASLAAHVRRRPRVYAEAWPKPRITSPPWVRELVAIAGGHPVFAAGRRTSDAEIVRARPEVIVIAWTATGDRPHAAEIIAKPEWQSLPAIKHRRVHVIRDELLNTPGPPLMNGVRELFRVLHPELARRRSARERD